MAAMPSHLPRIRTPAGSKRRQSVTVGKADVRNDQSGDGPLLALLGAIASRHHSDVARRLDSLPELATCTIHIGASRHGPDGYFLGAIRRHVYREDTAL